jgi:hypothetical protein
MCIPTSLPFNITGSILQQMESIKDIRHDYTDDVTTVIDTSVMPAQNTLTALQNPTFQ